MDSRRRQRYRLVAAGGARRRFSGEAMVARGVTSTQTSRSAAPPPSRRGRGGRRQRAAAAGPAPVSLAVAAAETPTPTSVGAAPPADGTKVEVLRQGGQGRRAPGKFLAGRAKEQEEEARENMSR